MREKMTYDEAIQHAAKTLAEANSVFVLSGAGLSAPSGLLTFRGAGGYWNGIATEQLASQYGFKKNPQVVWDWYNERIAAYLAAKPNPGHVALSDMERLTKHFWHGTQLVDGLMERAGATELSLLHGNVFALRCTKCNYQEQLTAPFDTDRLKHDCGGMLRPGVVWFGESLPEKAWNQAARHAGAADVILVVGTSGVVMPAASLAKRGKKDTFVFEINVKPTIFDADYQFTEGAEKTLPAISRLLKN